MLGRKYIKSAVRTQPGDATRGRPRDDIGDAHGRAGRRGRRPLPRPAPCPPTHATSAHARHARTWSGATSPARRTHGTTSGAPTGTRAAGDVGPYHAPRHVRQRTPRPHTHAMRVPMVGRDVPGAPRPRNDIGDDIKDAHGRAGRQGRRPLPRPAPCPPTHAMRAPGPARRPRRAAPTGRPRGRHRGRPRARGPPGTSAPTTPRAMSANATHATSAHARHARTHGRARRPRRAAPTERHRGRHQGRPRARGPPRTSAPTTPRAMSTNACHVRTRTPCAHPWQDATSPARRAQRAGGRHHAEQRRFIRSCVRPAFQRC